MKTNKIVVGLTGGIASGKSVAAEMFRAAGAYIIDTDVISRQVSDSAAGHAALKAAFFEAFDGDILNRTRLRSFIFAESEKRLRLNEIMHPLIAAQTEKQIAASAAPVTVMVAPLLFEAGFDVYCNHTVTVACDEQTRIDRLKKRDAIGEQLARNMVAAQMSDAARAARANMVLRNDGSLAELRAQVLRVYCELTDAIGR